MREAERLCRWVERSVVGDPPMDPHWRRNLDAVLDGRRLIVVGARSLLCCVCHACMRERIPPLPAMPFDDLCMHAELWPL